MQSYWINYANAGDPNAPGLPQWPVFSASRNWKVMNFNATSEARPDTTRDSYLFLHNAPATPPQPAAK
ncbi:MAG: hypothetical protein ABSG62_23405 [Terracidiphilus sp.]|jgi:para-nitrobenzyl esterase